MKKQLSSFIWAVVIAQVSAACVEPDRFYTKSPEIGNANKIYFDNTEWDTRLLPRAFECNAELSEKVKNDALGMRWYIARYTVDGKFVDIKKLMTITAGVAADVISGYSFNNETKELNIEPEEHFVDANHRSKNAYFLLCEAFESEDECNVVSNYQSIIFNDVPTEEDAVNIVPNSNKLEYENGSTEVMAECRSGYSNQSPHIKWVALNEDGTEFKDLDDLFPIDDRLGRNEIYDNTHDRSRKNIESTLQFQDGSLTGLFDKKYFECRVTYKFAEDRRLTDWTVKKTFPVPTENSQPVIRVEHDVSEVAFLVDGQEQPDSEGVVVVRKDEPISIDCTSNGFEIDGDTIVTFKKDGKKVEKSKVTFEKKEEFTCEAKTTSQTDAVVRSVVFIPKSIDAITAVENTIRRNIDPKIVTVTAESDSELVSKLKLSDGTKIDPIEQSNTDGHYKATYSVNANKDAVEVITFIKANSNIKENTAVTKTTGSQSQRLKTDDDHVVSGTYAKIPGHDGDQIKFWYNDCADDTITFAPLAADQGTVKLNDKEDTAGAFVEDPVAGVYIVCYDYKNDVDFSDQLPPCDAEADNFKFTGTNEWCHATHVANSTRTGFAWWWLLVLLLILIIVMLAILWWRRIKHDNDDDLEANNVDSIAGGHIDATQEDTQAAAEKEALMQKESNSES